MSRRPDHALAAARAVAIGALARTVYRRLEWWERPFGANIPPLVEAGVPLEYDFLDLDAALEWTAVHPDLDPDTVRERFARGDRCHGSRYEGRQVTVSWASTGTARVDWLDLVVPLPAEVFYHYDRYTVPDLRGLRIAPSSGSRLCRAMADEGHTTLSCTVWPENPSALQNVVGFDMVKTGTLGWYGIGPLKRTFRHPYNG